MKTLLEERGYKVLTARDGEEAIEMFRMHNSAIDIVFPILDYHK
jgi:CheY-like chemotaxis protein